MPPTSPVGRRPLRTFGLVALGLAAVSFSAPLVRLADAPPLAVAFYRNLIAAAVLLPAAWVRHREEIRSLCWRERTGLVLAGLLLAAHFAAWIPSIGLTTVAASTVLVSTQPIFAAAGARLLLGERVRPAVAAGIATALAGAALISGADFRSSPRAFLGDLLAIGGAVFAAGYFLTGRVLRRRLSLLTYAGAVYGVCALLLVPALLATGTPFSGYPGRTWWFFLALAAGPQIFGHTTFNYLLKDLDVTAVAVAVMGEPVGASLLAFLLFREVPAAPALIGSSLVLAGIYLALTSASRERASPPVG